MRKTTSRKLSSSNVDGHMASMSKIGEEIVAAEQNTTVLSRSIPSDSLLFESIAETLTRIATSTESFASLKELFVHWKRLLTQKINK